MAASLHGILVIDKPAGWTSHDVVGWVRKWTRERKVGHAGTLDPAATGVLPIALNDGTRVLEFLSDSSKAYLAEITFGVETDSADADGTVTATHHVDVSSGDVELALESFRGQITQVPPAYSAIHVDGKRAYDLARAGVEVDIPKRTVAVHELSIVERNHLGVTLHIDCSKGTYIRSIARDLGRILGCGAYLSNLVRTRSGPYTLCDAWTVDELVRLHPRDEWSSIAEHPDSGLPEWPSIVLSDADSRDWQFGRPIASTAAVHPARVRVYDNNGHWRGLAELDQEHDVWRALRVISAQ